MTFDLLKKHFPFEKMRLEQEIVLKKIAEEWSSKKFHVLALPCGVGKSPLAVAIGNAVRELEKKAVVTTPLKILQKQYSKDFSDDKFRMKEVMGRNNYMCNNPLGAQHGFTCADGPGFLSKDDCPHCPYVKARNAASEAQIALLNTTYYVHTKRSPYFNDRKVLIVDEGHNISEELVSMCEVKINNFAIRRAFRDPNVSIPELNSLKEYSEWLNKVLEVCTKYIGNINHELESFNVEASNVAYYKTRVSEMEKFVQLKTKIERYLDYSHLEWVWQYQKDEKDDKRTFISLKPLSTHEFAYDYIFSGMDKVILMSATFLSKKQTCRDLGIKEEDTQWIEVDSPFPIENHRFIRSYAGSLNYKEIKKTLPKLMVILQKIIDIHKDHKGIIHANSFAISEYIESTIKNDRLLIQKQGQPASEILKIHHERKDPTIIVSPSMTEGVDLFDDLSRWQIIVKLPFLFLGDKYIKTKAEKYPEWYSANMVTTFVQAMGRSIRNSNDWAVTYCTDPTFDYFIGQKAKNEGLLPSHIKKIIGV